MYKNPLALLVPELGSEIPLGELDASSLFSSDAKQHWKSLRIKMGEPLRLLNGKGILVDCTVVDSKKFILKILNEKKIEQNKIPIELCLAPPQGDALKEALLQSSEMGVQSICLIKSDFAQNTNKEPNWERLERILVSATEQCARAWHPEISHTWHTVSSLTADSQTIHILCDESLASQEVFGFTDRVPKIEAGKKIRLYIGPEGGWSDKERSLFQKNVFKLSLGSQILRVPTACVAALSFLNLLRSPSQ